MNDLNAKWLLSGAWITLLSVPMLVYLELASGYGFSVFGLFRLSAISSSRTHFIIQCSSFVLCFLAIGQSICVLNFSHGKFRVLALIASVLSIALLIYLFFL